MHTIKITPNLLFKCTSGKFINCRIELNRKKIDSIARIKSNFFCPNWNALVPGGRVIPYGMCESSRSGGACCELLYSVRRLPLQVGCGGCWHGVVCVKA